MSPERRPSSEATIEEVVSLCRRLRLKYVREQVPDVVLTVVVETERLWLLAAPV